MLFARLQGKVRVISFRDDLSRINVMKTLTTQLLSLACLSSALFTGAGFASETQGGVIHFVGAIVEDPCNVTTRSQQISMSCYRDGIMHTSNVSYRQAITGKLVNNDAATVSMRYLNVQKTLGIVTVDYR
jgi:type 1 fimbria pilin